VIEDFEKKALIVNGHTVYMIASKTPEEVDYTAFELITQLWLTTRVLHATAKGLKNI